jgi:hypothetical protein
MTSSIHACGEPTGKSRLEQWSASTLDCRIAHLAGGPLRRTRAELGTPTMSGTSKTIARIAELDWLGLFREQSKPGRGAAQDWT